VTTTYYWMVYPDGLIAARLDATQEIGTYRLVDGELRHEKGYAVLPEWARTLIASEMSADKDHGKITGGTVSLVGSEEKPRGDNADTEDGHWPTFTEQQAQTAALEAQRENRQA